MTENSNKLTRRRVLSGLVTTGAAGAAAGAGTMAYFSDTESISDQTIQAGTLNLTLDTKNQDVTFLTETDLVPPDSGYSDLEVANTGTVDGSLTVAVSAIRSLDKNGNTGGNLDNYVYVGAKINDTTDPTSYTPVSDLSVNQDLITNHTMAGGATDMFYLHWEFRDEGGVNNAKGHRLELDLSFQLDQTGGP